MTSERTQIIVVLGNISGDFTFYLRTSHLRCKGITPALATSAIIYLEQADTLTITLDSDVCYCCEENIRVTSNLLTDGQWYWSGNLAHYVEMHGLIVPDLFQQHLMFAIKEHKSISFEEIEELAIQFLESGKFNEIMEKVETK
jgi:hypothetical protein